jgi:hypothetical protein
METIFISNAVKFLFDQRKFAFVRLTHKAISLFQNIFILRKKKSCDGSVGIALGYGLDDRGSRARFPAGAVKFSLYHRVKKCSGAHPASYPMGTRGSFPGGKAAGT